MNPATLSEFINEIIIKSGILGTDKSFIDGLTRRQVHIVMEIGTNVFRHGDLADRLGVDPSTLTRSLDPLYKQGIVDRQLNPDNRREVLIQLCDKGFAVLEEINDKMNRISSQILEHVPDHQTEMVDTSIDLLLTILKQLQFKH
ncbi:MarR family transcriptional regulator [Paenibacillus humicola]|uniref:MarR family transcriptional regulator n=1 Tax=Paenibacillus humicola TaxID=3110540 RepID=UPI00237C365C|nr:MarR family transcriptional regulator [Paenibacillus humicola]